MAFRCAHRLLDLDQTGSRFFNKIPAQGFPSLSGRHHTQVRFMADTQYDGVEGMVPSRVKSAFGEASGTSAWQI